MPKQKNWRKGWKRVRSIVPRSTKNWRKGWKRVRSIVPRSTKDDSKSKGLVERGRKIVLRGTPKRRGGSRG